jgi:hypothetical protein
MKVSSARFTSKNGLQCWFTLKHTQSLMTYVLISIFHFNFNYCNELTEKYLNERLTKIITWILYLHITQHYDFLQSFLTPSIYLN